MFDAAHDITLSPLVRRNITHEGSRLEDAPIEIVIKPVRRCRGSGYAAKGPVRIEDDQDIGSTDGHA